MVLLVEGSSIENAEKTLGNLSSFLKAHGDVYAKNAQYLRNSAVTSVSSEDAALYVAQREYAVVHGDDEKVLKVGTDMATTCHMVVLRCGGITALAHFDGTATSQGINDMAGVMLGEILHISPSLIGVKTIDIDLHIIGGFEDDRGLSEDLSTEILQEFNVYKSAQGVPKVHFNLKTFCASSLNTLTVTKTRVARKSDGSTPSQTQQKKIKAPAVLGILVDCKSGNICKAVFDHSAKGPEAQLRSARSLNGVKNMDNIYRPRERVCQIAPFTYKPMTHVDLWLDQPDYKIRKYMSTSPDVEPDNFEEHIRETLTFIRDHPDPMKSVFKSGHPLTFDPSSVAGKLTWVKR